MLLLTCGRLLTICLFVGLCIQQWKLFGTTLPYFLTTIAVLFSFFVITLKWLQLNKPSFRGRRLENISHLLRIPDSPAPLPKDVKRTFFILSFLELLLTVCLPIVMEVVEGMRWLALIVKYGYSMQPDNKSSSTSVLDYLYKVKNFLLSRVEEDRNLLTKQDFIERKMSTQTLFCIIRILVGKSISIEDRRRKVYWNPSHCLSRTVAPHLFMFSAQIATEASVISFGGEQLGRVILFHVTLLFNLFRCIPAFTSLYQSVELIQHGQCNWSYVIMATIPCLLWVYSTFVFCLRKWLPLYKKLDHRRSSPNTLEAAKEKPNRKRK